MNAPEALGLGKIRWLRCACCGSGTRGRQWPNQDTGFGLCASCGDWIPATDRSGEYTPEGMRRTYGVRGVHYDIPGEPK